MNYEDDKLPSEQLYEKLANEFREKLKPQEQISELPPQQMDEETTQKMQQLITLLSENEQHLTYLNDFMQKNVRYKVTAQNIQLSEALGLTQKHKNQLLSLQNVQLHESQKPSYNNRNVKSAIYNCCNNQGNLLNTLLWLALFKNLFGNNNKILTQMAYEQTEVLKTVMKLF